ncbi:MAG: CDP-alcohol phosphatidyltransferase family protein [Candidatus Bathyarchaeia archaeon]
MIPETSLTRFSFLKRLNANLISGLSLVCSPIVYLLISKRAFIACIIALFFVLLFDVLDGVVARAKGQTSSEVGWMVDVSVDRISEALISLALSRVYMLLVVLNMGLTLRSCKFRKQALIPLRHLLLLMLLLYYLVKLQPITLFLDQILFDW